MPLCPASLTQAGADPATLTELALHEGTDREVRISALSALSHLATPGVEASFIAVLTSDAEPAVRQAALRAVQRLGAVRARPVLEGILTGLSDTDPWAGHVSRALAEAR